MRTLDCLSTRMRTGALWLSLWIGPRLRLIAIFVGSFPASFEFLDLIYGVRDGTDDKYHWRLVRRSYNKAILYGKSLVDGHDLLSEANPSRYVAFVLQSTMSTLLS